MLWITLPALFVAGIAAYLEFHWEEDRKTRRQRRVIRLLLVAMVLTSIVSEVVGQHKSGRESAELLKEIRRTVRRVDHLKITLGTSIRNPELARSLNNLALQQESAHWDLSEIADEKLRQALLSVVETETIAVGITTDRKGLWLLKGRVDRIVARVMPGDLESIHFWLECDLKSRIRSPGMATLDDFGGAVVLVEGWPAGHERMSVFLHASGFSLYTHVEQRGQPPRAWRVISRILLQDD